MGCCSDDGPSKIQPVSPRSPNESSIEEPIFRKRRSCTDLFALIIFIGFLGGFVFFVSFGIRKGDVFRVFNGYDDCANICGRKNEKLPDSSDVHFCRGDDMSKKPYLMAEWEGIGVKSRTCMSNCSEKTGEEYVIFFNRCIPKKKFDQANSATKFLGLNNFFEDAIRDLTNVWRDLIYLFLIALAISLLLLIAFRFCVAIVIYLVLVLTVLASIGGSTYLWLMWRKESQAVSDKKIAQEDSYELSYKIYAIIATIVTVLVVLIILVMRKRIELVIQLFKEAGKVVASMPVLLFQPIYTYLILGATIIGLIYSAMWIESAGDPYINKKNHTHFKKDTILYVGRYYTVFIFFMTSEFYLGCQHMLVAGAVARWFFTRDKSRLSLPVVKSAGNVIKYHLGTIAFGSMIIAIVRLIRFFLQLIQKYLKKSNNAIAAAFVCLCDCCLRCFESFLRFIGRNAYIETAIYGCNFCTGGRRAFRALSDNVLRVSAINSVGDFVLFLGKVLVVLLTVLSGFFMLQKREGITYPWLPITLGGLFAFVIAHCFISIYEMIIDTIFICFCEDCEKNDGISKPYYMSKGLMEFVENSKKALKILDQRKNEPHPQQNGSAHNAEPPPPGFMPMQAPNGPYPMQQR